MKMRDLITLAENAMRLPQKLYHGTSRSGWESIRNSDTLIAHDDLDFLSFTEDYNTAFRFARDIARKFGEKGDGVLLVLDGVKLAEHWPLEQCHGQGALYGHKEWRLPMAVLRDVKDFLIDVEDNSMRGDLYEAKSMKGKMAKREPKMRPDADDIRAMKRIRHECRRWEGGGGMCHLVSEWIEDNFGWERVSGTYLSADGEIVCGGGHLWNILPDGAILDATADQFGEGYDVRIVEPNDPEYQRYDIEWYEDFHPQHPDYDPTWDRIRRSPDKFTGELDFDLGDRLRQERGDYWWVKDRKHAKAYDRLTKQYERGKFKGPEQARWDAAWAYGDEE